MIGRADPDTGCNGAEFTDFRIRHLTIMAKVGCIAKRRICHRGSFQNLTTHADVCLT
jgi:hypothetical protein